MLEMVDVGRVAWLCAQLDPAQLLAAEPLPLSQSVLLALMQQLGSDLAHVRPARSFPTRPALPLQLPPTVLHATVCAALLASVVLHAANHLCGEDSVNK